MNYGSIGFGIFLILFGYTGMPQASLVTIGTATYKGSEYKLIWDNDNNGKSVVWLDYINPFIFNSVDTASENDWTRQLGWAAGLGGEITSYNISPGYNVTWDENAWRLPSTRDGVFSWGNLPKDGSGPGGYNVTYSELGHLYHVELGNMGYFNADGSPTGIVNLQNKGPFSNLGNTAYWYSTLYSADPVHAWLFGMFNGAEANGRFIDLDPNSVSYNNPAIGNNVNGIALRDATVSSAEPVPEPATMILFGAGLAGLAGLRRIKKY